MTATTRVAPDSSANSPRLPSLLTLPLGFVPPRLNSALLAQILNRVFKPELADGELDFLEDRVMLIRVDDARLSYRLTLQHGRLAALLATRREDPDTLFFNRRLRLGGDTELGLYAKNLLDSLELEGRLGPLLAVMNRAADVMGRFGRKRR
jgi:predicted lipid carrier protein YhbT